MCSVLFYSYTYAYNHVHYVNDEIIVLHNSIEKLTANINESQEKINELSFTVEKLESKLHEQDAHIQSLYELCNKNETEKSASCSYTDEELYILSHVIYGEAGGYSRELQIGVGSVVLNRVKHENYPNTIKEVVFQKRQYACTWDGNYDREPDQQAIDVAIYLLENGSQFPEHVIYQAGFKQGKGVYKQIGNTYFCY